MPKLMTYIYSALSATNHQSQKTSRLIVNQDGEPDDHAALLTVQNIMNQNKIRADIFATYGNPKVTHNPDNAPKDGETDEQQVERSEREIALRVKFTKALVHNASVYPGGRSNQDSVDAYQKSTSDQCHGLNAVLHTASFASLNPVKDTPVFSYGAFNLTKGLEDSSDEQSYMNYFKKFNDVEGAKLYLAEGFPLLGANNKINAVNTPLTYHLDTTCLKHTRVGREYNRLVDQANDQVRPGQIKKLRKGILESIAKARDEQRSAIRTHITTLIQACLAQDNDNLPLEDALEAACNAMNQTFLAGQHAKVLSALDDLLSHLTDNELLASGSLDRRRNIYAGTSYKGQALIADQIAAQACAEYIECHQNGLLQLFQPVSFSGLIQNRYTSYSLGENSSIFHANASRLIKTAFPNIDKENHGAHIEKLQKLLLSYLDVCFTADRLLHPSLISDADKVKLLTGDFGEEFAKKVAFLKDEGFNAPNAIETVLAERQRLLKSLSQTVVAQSASFFGVADRSEQGGDVEMEYPDFKASGR